jgi:hypothetical protein
MEVTEDTQPIAIAGRQRAHRSSVSTGSRLFAVAGLDGRCQTARRFRDLVEIMTLDLGGPDLMTKAKRQLVRRAAMLSAESERSPRSAWRGRILFT